jgi:hypothetical protein
MLRDQESKVLEKHEEVFVIQISPLVADVRL